MKSKRSLSRRITLAFVLMTLAVSAVFAVNIYNIFDYVEQHLVSQRLDQQLSEIVRNQQTGGKPGKLRHFSTDASGAPIPEQYAKLKNGVDELTQQGQAYYSYRQSIDGVDHVLIQDQGDFITHEKSLYLRVVIGFLLSLLFSALVGWLMARHVMSPVVRLAGQVDDLQDSDGPPVTMSDEYANDEVGRLAKAFERSFLSQRQSLQRERLFTSDVSHELRTPLMVIGSSCEILAGNPNLSATQLEHVHRIQRSSDDMRDLVETFLTLARANTQGGADTQRISLQDAATEQYDKWQAAFHTKRLQLLMTSEAIDTGLYNAVFLKTVISNLLRNALHYTHQGRVELILTQSRLTVRDSGIGIAPSKQDLIFEPFYRVNALPAEGLGLGLSLVQRICQHQGWQVSYQPVQPHGSAFIIDFAYS